MAKPEPRGRPARVLVAFHNPETRRLLQVALTRVGIEVWQAADWLELELQIAQLESTNSRMAPIILGVELLGLCAGARLARLRIGAPPSTIFLVVSLGDAGISSARYRTAGARVLEQPFDLVELRREVLQICRHELVPEANCVR